MKHFRQSRSPGDAGSDNTLSRQGADICRSCGARLPPGRDRCLICGSFGAVSPRDSSRREPLPSGTPTDILHLRKITRRAIGAAVLLLTVLVAVVATVQTLHYNSLLSRYTDDSFLLYIQQNSLYLTLHTLEAPVAIAARTGAGQIRAETHAERRYVAYLAKDYGKNSLYLLDLLELDTQSDAARRGVLLAENVADFRFFPDSLRLVYTTHHGELNSVDFSGMSSPLFWQPLRQYRLDSGVSRIEYCAGRQVLYRKGSGAGSFSLFYSPADAQTAPTQVGGRVRQVLDIDREMEKILFLADGDWQGSGAVLYDRRQNRSALLAENVAMVSAASAQDERLLYLTAHRDRLPNYYELINDDLLEQDAEMTPPDPRSYGVTLFSAADASPDSDYSRYLQDLQRWEDKVARDQMREALINELAFNPDRYFSLYDLHLYSDGKDTALDQAISRWGGDFPVVRSDFSKSELLYLRCDPSRGQPIPLSSLNPYRTGDYGLPGLLPLALPEELVYSRLSGGTEQVAYSGSGAQVLSDARLAGGQGIYYTVCADLGQKTSTLYFAPLRSGDVRASGHAGGQVLRLLDFAPGQQGSPLLFLAQSSSKVNLLAADGANSQPLAENISLTATTPALPSNGRAVLYYRRWDTRSATGSLYAYREQEDLIASRVRDFAQIGGHIYLLVKDSDSGGILYVYSGSSLSARAGQVSELIHPQRPQ